MKLGQVDLFTKRVRKPPAAPEKATHIALADLLNKGGLAPGWVWFHPANGELRTDATGALLKRMGVRPGVSDFILIAPPAGQVHALELKRRGLKPSDAQWAFMLAITAIGGNCDWADNYEDAVGILRGWGALRVSL